MLVTTCRDEHSSVRTQNCVQTELNCFSVLELNRTITKQFEPNQTGALLLKKISANIGPIISAKSGPNATYNYDSQLVFPLSSSLWCFPVTRSLPLKISNLQSHRHHHHHTIIKTFILLSHYITSTDHVSSQVPLACNRHVVALRRLNHRLDRSFHHFHSLRCIIVASNSINSNITTGSAPKVFIGGVEIT